MDRAETKGLIFDSFAGGGGASLGIEWALGRGPDFAVNHDADALLMHAKNHPLTIHLQENIWKVDPHAVTNGKPVFLLWASPDCRHFSKSKGGKPVSRSVRGLADVILLWAQEVKPRIILMENVEEFRDWGPLDEAGFPIKEQKGKEFARWVRGLEARGYMVEFKELRARDYGAPTIRKRLFVVARRDMKPVVWPAPTHAVDGIRRGRWDEPWLPPAQRPSGLTAYRTAAEIIDWSIRAPSIFLTKAEAKAQGLNVIRPLATKSEARIANGFGRHVLKRDREGGGAFVVAMSHGETGPNSKRWGKGDYDLGEPLRTVTGSNDFGVVAPFVGVNRFDSDGRAPDAPMPTITANSFEKRPGAGGPLSVVTPFVSYAQQGGGSRPADEPHQTVCANAKDQNTVVTPFLAVNRTSDKPTTDADGPTHTVTAQGAAHTIVMGYLVSRYGERPATDAAPAQEPRSRGLGEPYPTVVGTGNGGDLAAVYIAQQNTDMIGHDPEKPLSTIVQKGCTQTPVVGYLAQANGGPRAPIGRDADEPAASVTTSGAQVQPVLGYIAALRRNTNASGLDEPIGTVSTSGAHHALIAPFVTSYYSEGGMDAAADEPMPTVPTKARFSPIHCRIEVPPLTPAMLERAKQVARFLHHYGVWHSPDELVTIGEGLIVWDIGMRMLTPRELARAQGFPDSYDITAGGQLTETAQRHKIGNSVCPHVAAALVYANCVEALSMPDRKRRRRCKLPRFDDVRPDNDGQPTLFAGEAA